MTRFLLQLVAFLTLFLGSAELLLRTLVPASRAPLMGWDDAFGVMHPNPKVATDGVYTIGRVVLDRVPWHINAQGWNAPEDYAPAAPGDSPLVAVVGDSYVQGLHVTHDQHVASQLREALGGSARVYRFGFAGAALTDYVRLIALAEERYAPDAVVVLVVEDDIKEAVENLGRIGKINQLVEGDGGGFAWREARTYRPNKWRRRIRNSALVRYLLFNAKVDLRMGGAPPPPPSAQELAAAQAESERLQPRAAAFLVERLAEAAAGKPVVMMVDGPRAGFVAGEAPPELPELGWLRAAAAAHPSVTVHTLSPAMFSLWERGVPLDTHGDPHWSPAGHALVAQEAATALATRGWRD